MSNRTRWPTIGVLAVAAWCGVAPPVRADPAHAAGVDHTLRATDWCNTTFGDAMPTMMNCRGTLDQRHTRDGGIWGFLHYRFLGATYGDLTGDGREDALLMYETTLAPVIKKPREPLATDFDVLLIVHRGDDLYEYTSESTDTAPTSVTIADGAATFLWRERARTCTQTWRFGARGETATKTSRACTPVRPATP